MFFLSSHGIRCAVLGSNINTKQGGENMKTREIKSFGEQPDRFRNTVRDVIDSFGGSIKAYANKGITVAMPNTNIGALTTTLEKLGLKSNDACFSAICSNNPPETQRHKMHKYGHDEKGSWFFYMIFTLTQNGR